MSESLNTEAPAVSLTGLAQSISSSLIEESMEIEIRQCQTSSNRGVDGVEQDQSLSVGGT